MGVLPADLASFVAESNRIEGIIRPPTDGEMNMMRLFLSLTDISVPVLQDFVRIYQPGASLRERRGLDVRVGNHIAPRGGPEIVDALNDILDDAAHPGAGDPWTIHCRYEDLHPFTDGNGRSGRALWAWMMVQLGDDLSLGFLRRFYYQTLERFRA